MQLASFGMPFLWIALAFAACSLVLYLKAATNGLKQEPAGLKLASACYGITLTSVVAVCFVLAALLLTHDFSIDYVYRYSSRELPPGYLFATFWAGQDGSFLLWAFWVAVLGLVLLLTLQPKRRAQAMTIYTPVLIFLLALLIVRNPFAPYSADPGQLLHPLDGIGLNPLLENPWMVVHPPTLFLGFAGLTIPFCFATASLVWDDDPNWYRQATPWALFTFAVLGLGVMLGGYWAYETLGWGGFWGWDPVEDGPLVPWLTTVAFLHAVQVTGARGGSRKSVQLLAMCGFVAALYETFLTRTGILDKFSNHSFSTLGGVANSIVLYGLLVVTVVSVALLIVRYRKTKSDIPFLSNAGSREFGLSMAVLLLIACAVIVASGMSAPLITSALVAAHWMRSESSVGADFFNKANFPEAVLLAFGMGVVPLLTWGKAAFKSKSTIVASMAAAVVLALAYTIVGSNFTHTPIRPVMGILLIGTLFAIVSNASLIALKVRASHRQSIPTLGGAIAHIGAALIFLGVIGIVLFTHKESPFLVQDRPVKLTGIPYQITFKGMSSDLFDSANNLQFDISDQSGKRQFTELMPFAVRNVEGVHQLLARPAIAMRWWGDLYFAFESGPVRYAPNKTTEFTVSKGKTVKEDGCNIALTGYRVPPEVDALVAKGVIPDQYPITALLHIVYPDGKSDDVGVINTRYKDDPIAPAMPETIVQDDSVGQLALCYEGTDPTSGDASFYIRNASQPLFIAYTVEVSTRPTIGLVWIGTLMIFIGGLISMVNRRKELKRDDPDGKQGPKKSGKFVEEKTSFRVDRTKRNRKPVVLRH